MTIRVEIEGKGQIAEFPEGTDQAVIDQVIQRDFFGKPSPPPRLRQPGESPIIPEEKARLKWRGPEGQGAVYPTGEDPRQSFLRNVAEGFFDPTQILANMAGGYSQAGLKGAIDWALAGAPSVARGAKGFMANLMKGLSAKEIEKRIPAAITTPIKVEPPTAAAQPTITELASKALRPTPTPTPPPEPVAPTQQLLEEAHRIILPPAKKLPKPRFQMTADELIAEKAKDVSILGWIENNPNETLSKIAKSQFNRTGKLTSTTRKEVERRMAEIPPKMILPSAAEKAEAFARSGTLLKPAYEVPPLSYQEAQATQGARRVREAAAAETLPPPQPPTPPPTGGPASSASSRTALTENEWRFLKEDPTKIAHRGIWSKMKATGRGALMEVQSPYEVFAKEPSGVGMQFWEISEKVNRYRNVFLQKQYTEFKKAIPFGPGTPQSNLVGELLDRYADWKEVMANAPPEIRRHLTPEIKKAFTYIRDNWSKLGDDLISRGMMTPTRKIGAYLFHMFDRDTIFQAMKDELTMLRATGGDLGRIKRLEHAVDTFTQTGALLYDVLPKSLNIPFLNPRKGAPGYSLDAVRAYNAWIKYYAKKIYVEPVLKVGVESMKVMNPEYRQYTKEYLRRYADLDKDWKLAPLERALTSLTYINALGWNTRSALVNATQHLNTVIELGPKGPVYMMRALNFAHTPEGKALWEASGHAAEVPELRWGMMEKHVEKALGSAFYLFDKVELGNRKLAFLSGYLKALSGGATIEVAKKFGDTLLRKTQFLYGKVGSPMLMTRPGGRVTMQFTTFSIKQLELFSRWARKNPEKLAAYLITAGAAQEGLQALGVDLGNALGVGVDIGELTNALLHFGRGEGRAGWVHAKLGLPQTPLTPFAGGGGGIFPSGIAPSIDMVSKLIQGKWEKTIPPQAERLWTAGRALAEGKLPEGGYPVRVPGEPTLRHRETPAQLFSRTFLARPTVESEASKEILKERMFEESRRSRMEKIVDLILSGRREEARKLAQIYGWPAQQMIEAERERRRKTTVERRRKVRPPFGVHEQYKKKIGETGR